MEREGQAVPAGGLQDTGDKHLHEEHVGVQRVPGEADSGAEGEEQEEAGGGALDQRVLHDEDEAEDQEGRDDVVYDSVPAGDHGDAPLQDRVRGQRGGRVPARDHGRGESARGHSGDQAAAHLRGSKDRARDPGEHAQRAARGGRAEDRAEDGAQELQGRGLRGRQRGHACHAHAAHQLHPVP